MCCNRKKNKTIKAWKITTDDYKRAFGLPDEPQNAQSEGEENAPTGNIPNPKLYVYARVALPIRIHTKPIHSKSRILPVLS